MKRLLALILSTFCLTVLTFCQSEKMSWKEYVYETDGFALTVPSEPTPHPDAIFPETTDYSVTPHGAYWGITLRVMHQNRDCSATLGELKTGANNGKGGTDPSSVRDISIAGHPGVEYRSKIEWAKPPQVSLERYYCVNGRFYIFTLEWESARQLPPEGMRIMDSFHLLKKGAAKPASQ
jgi:hypothetical protein